jgi:hypothetical protein
MEQIIELENNDDITSIRSRVDFALTRLAQESAPTNGKSERARLLLIIPRKNKALHSLVNMKLLARLVKSRAVEMAIVSPHPVVRDYAKEAEIKAFGSVRRARWGGWITKKAPVAPPQETLPPVAPSPLDEITTRKKNRGRVQRKKYEVAPGDNRPGAFKLMSQQLGWLLVIAMLSLALVVGALALLPQATVTLTPVAQSIETELIVKADPKVNSVNFQELTFPARITQVELALAGEIETVETELAPIGRASGRVIFINRTEVEQVIPISTTLSTSSGTPVEFTTAETATIPPGIGSTTTPTLVIASEPGPQGNVRTGQINQFSSPSFGLIARVINEEPTNGGAFEPARIVVNEDKPRLEAYLRQQVQQEGLKQLQASLGEQEFIPPESVQVIVLDVKYREFSGDFSDAFGGEMQAVVRATVIGGYNANRLALAALEAQTPPGHKLNLEGLNFGAGEVLDFQDGVATFRIIASGQAAPVIDQHRVAEDITWLSIGEAQELLTQQYPLATVPGIELNPAWLVELLGRLPFSSLQIEVVINEAVTAVAGGS